MPACLQRDGLALNLLKATRFLAIYHTPNQSYNLKRIGRNATSILDNNGKRMWFFQ